MLRLKLTRRETSFIKPANPARLHGVRAFRVDIYSAHTARAYLALVAAAVVVTYAGCVNQLSSDEFNAPIAALTFICLLAAFITVVLSRKIASITIHCVPLGATLPTIGRETTEDPKREQELARAFFIRGHQRSDPFSLNLAVRQTEPNVAARLESYYQQSQRGLVLLSNDEEHAQARFLESRLDQQRCASMLAKRIASHKALKSDIWPIARLAISRILYVNRATDTYSRAASELGKRPPSRGAHYYLAFKSNLLVVAWWFVTLAAIINLTPLFSSDVEKRVASLAGGGLALMWAGCSMAYMRRIVANWRKWLVVNGRRPLGLLPVFMYRPHAEALPNWEELDEYDFNLYVDQYLLDVRTGLAIVQAAFLGGLLAVAQWFNG